MAEGKAGFHNNRILGKSDSGKLDKFSVQSHQPLKQPHENTTYISGPHVRSKEPNCPECASQRVWRDGLRRTAYGDVQRWICRECGYRFSENGSKGPLQKPSNWSINSATNIVSSRQVCELLTEDSKNLATSETRLNQAAGATEKVDAKGKILEHAWWLKKNAKSDATIETRTILLKMLVHNGADLFNPENVKEVIALYKCQDGSKKVMVDAYKSFAKFLGISWDPPKYKSPSKIPFIPLEREIDDLIACCSKRTAALLQLLKETGARLGEALQLRWTNIDTECRVVRIEPEKGSNPRILKISEKVLGMVNSLPKDSEKIFGGRNKRKVFIESLNKTRKKASAKLQNPRLLQIHYHTLRHWKGTIEYHKTHDPWHVKKLLGHKSMQSTELYINIEQAIFELTPEEFHVKVTSDSQEIKGLLEVGFEYVCEKDGLMFFRKRK